MLVASKISVVYLWLAVIGAAGLIFACNQEPRSNTRTDRNTSGGESIGLQVDWSYCKRVAKVTIENNTEDPIVFDHTLFGLEIYSGDRERNWVRLTLDPAKAEWAVRTESSLTAVNSHSSLALNIPIDTSQCQYIRKQDQLKMYIFALRKDSVSASVLAKMDPETFLDHTLKFESQ